MDGNSLVVGERYLFRLRGKQVPVVYMGRFWNENTYQTNLHLRRLDLLPTGYLYRRTARALSKHFDNCALVGREDCRCAERLSTV